MSSQLSSSATEFTELSSRKTSSASSFFMKSQDGWPSNSTSPYEDRLLQTKDEGKDRWEFPRHHLKFYGILGKSVVPTSHKDAYRQGRLCLCKLFNFVLCLF